MDYLDPFAPLFWQTTGLAITCGGLVGLERQLRGKVAGVRTSILICLSTALFVHLGASVAGPEADPARVLGQIVTGVGFLGAGVMLTRDGVVHGVTTAAVIWMLAAIGATIGLGYFAAALALSAVTVAILTGIELLEKRLKALARGVHARGRGDDGS
jgi:putative Mg2+ transporter-C (MgtC) family protein